LHGRRLSWYDDRWRRAVAVEQTENLAAEVRPLAWCRAAIGAVLLLRTTPLLAPLDLWFLRDAYPLLGWPDAAWKADTALALPPSIVIALCVVRTVAAGLFLVGAWTRAAGLVAGTAGYVVMAQTPFGFIFTLHLLYQAAILLALTDSATSFALRPRAARSPATSLLVIRCWTASIYAWAGIYKLRADWLDGRALGLFHADGAIHNRLADFLLATSTSRAVVGSGVALFELVIGPLLLWKRTRTIAVIVAFAFHAGLELMARPDLLGWGMASLLLSFVEPGAEERAGLRPA
jgi:vitamin K-dependent gamma-carboxylase-like protein